MNREIKFRVWEKGTPNLLGYEHFNTSLNNGFMYVNLSELKEGEDEGDLICHSEFHNPPMLRPKGFNGLFREQYTGLKDENGVDIYEGDIVRITDFDSEIYHISFYEGFFCALKVGQKLSDFKARKDESPLVFTNYFMHETVVIGNIHQNPELI